MLTYVAKRITAFLVPEKNDRESELCQYGCEIWLYTVFSTIGLVALGVLLGLSLLIMLRYPICLHPNKQYLSRNAKLIWVRTQATRVGTA